MHPLEQHYLDITRRRFFGVAGATLGATLGTAALASLLGRRALAGPAPDLALPGPHFRPRRSA